MIRKRILWVCLAIMTVAAAVCSYIAHNRPIQAIPYIIEEAR